MNLVGLIRAESRLKEPKARNKMKSHLNACMNHSDWVLFYTLASLFILVGLIQSEWFMQTFGSDFILSLTSAVIHSFYICCA